MLTARKKHRRAADFCDLVSALLAFGRFTRTDTQETPAGTVAIVSAASYRIWELPLFLFLGVAGGLLGALFNYVNQQLCVWRKKYVNKSRLRRIVEVCCFAFV